MGMRGPAPAPTALKIIRGNPGKRALPKNEPKPQLTDRPYQPDDLDEIAREEWSRLAPILFRCRVLTEADYLVLAMICRLESRRKKAQLKINEFGMAVKGPNGGPVINPFIRVAQECENQLRPLLREVGITPSSRSGVTTVSESAPSSPWAKLKSQQ